MKIVVLDGYTLNPGDNPWTLLEELGEVEIFDRTSLSQRFERLEEANIIITNKCPIDEELLSSLRNIQFISITATGVDTVDCSAAQQKNIPVANVPEYASQTVAQFVFAQILHFAHKVHHHDKLIRSGDWQKKNTFSFWVNQQIELAGKNLGIVGFGKIGKEVAKLAQAFGMDIFFTTTKPSPDRSTMQFKHVTLSELIQRSDFISLHCPLTPNNINLVNHQFLSKMKHTAFLINTARGDLVSEKDLSHALLNGKIAGAALDVFSTEPLSSSSPLLTTPNCLLTPHMAWTSVEARKRLMATTVENIAAFMKGNPQNIVNDVALNKNTKPRNKPT